MVCLLAAARKKDAGLCVSVDLPMPDDKIKNPRPSDAKPCNKRPPLAYSGGGYRRRARDQRI